jgi:hypothetical protein
MRDLILLSRAISNLHPGKGFALDGDDLSTLQFATPCEWVETDIDAEYARLQTEYETQEYQRQRAAEYPSFADQFDLLYHGGYDAWKAAIDAVKTKYPKE